jgi:hypothetical protein
LSGGRHSERDHDCLEIQFQFEVEFIRVKNVVQPAAACLLRAFALLRFTPLAVSFLLMPDSASASTLITFDGLKDQESIGNYYNGGLGSLGSGPGPQLGLSFSGATVRLASDAGGTANFLGEPSPVAALFSPGFVTLDSSAGMLSVSFYYSNPFGTTEIRSFSGPDLRGTILSDTLLPNTPAGPGSAFPSFAQVTITFSGAPVSIAIVSQSLGGLYLDNMLVETTAATVPELPSAFGAAASFFVFALYRRYRTQ